MFEDTRLLEKTIHVKDLTDTQQIGFIIGQNLKGGESIELRGDLGSGKTTLTKAIVLGSGSNDHVSSPTFTISKIYKSKKFKIYHYDFYRLNDIGLIANELSDYVGGKDSVLIIEWGSNFKDVLPSPRIIIEITPITDESRKIDIKYFKSHQYIIRNIQ